MRNTKENRSSGQGQVPSFALRSRDQERGALDQSLLDGRLEVLLGDVHCSQALTVIRRYYYDFLRVE